MKRPSLRKTPDDDAERAARLLDTSGCLYCEEYFKGTLALERKRAERSGKNLHLMLMNFGGAGEQIARHRMAKRLAQVLAGATRETDIKGWYKRDSVMGVLFTETNGTDPAVLRRKVESGISAAFPGREREQIAVTYHVFPDAGGDRHGNDDDLALYPDLPERTGARRAARFIKRSMDVAGGIAGILLFSPVFLLATVLIKLTSPGPVLFRQERVGRYGRTFTFLKFRSMRVNSDERVHREYVRKLITGTARGEGGGTQKVFKITQDDRVTPVGLVLRKTSMDELPQFFNVLRGDMSLVGPRPPIPYEVEQYDTWHRRRVMEIKPGITGLWQVEGRSSTTFDEMVRLDLQYAREWSIWLDIRILLRTPWAVLRGKGAY